MSESLHPSAPHDLPGFITAPGDTDVLMVVVGIVLVGAVLVVGNLYLHLHALPERMAHKSQKLQFEIVAVLGLLALFTHNHLFWVIGLLLAMVDLPDFGTPLRRIAGSVEKIAGVPHGRREPPSLPVKELRTRDAEGPACESRRRQERGAGPCLSCFSARLLTILPDYLYRRYWPGKALRPRDHILFGMVRTEVRHRHLPDADRRA